jgi:MoxR-vWA-beta-propeller ternary system domain bpX2
MGSPLHDICCASIPADCLPVLSPLRCASDIRVTLIGERAWVHWQPGDEEVLASLLAAPGVALYRQRDGKWYRHGRHLPSFDVPTDAKSRRLDEVLTPAPVRATPVSLVGLEAVQAHLVRDSRPRATTAVRCSLNPLAEWAEHATSVRLTQIQAGRTGDWVLLLGAGLPALPGSERFWGQRILVPLGYAVQPRLPEAALVEAFGLEDTVILLLTQTHAQLIPQSAFQPLTRAGIRMALQEAP